MFLENKAHFFGNKAHFSENKAHFWGNKAFFLKNTAHFLGNKAYFEVNNVRSPIFCSRPNHLPNNLMKFVEELMTDVRNVAF